MGLWTVVVIAGQHGGKGGGGCVLTVVVDGAVVVILYGSAWFGMSGRGRRLMFTVVVVVVVGGGYSCGDCTGLPGLVWRMAGRWYVYGCGESGWGWRHLRFYGSARLVWRGGGMFTVVVSRGG